jgi:hypothetical protein
LLANPFRQSTPSVLTHRVRQQAGSYRCCSAISDRPATAGHLIDRNCNVLLKSPIGACPRAAIAVSGLTLCLPNERSGGRDATRDHALNL